MRVRTIDEVASEATSRPRFRAQLVGVLATVAMMLAAVGIAGVLAFSVQQRTRELGIRMALGARALDILRLVLGDGLRLTAIGVFAGLAGAAALSRFLESLLFGVKTSTCHIRRRAHGLRPGSADRVWRAGARVQPVGSPPRHCVTNSPRGPEPAPTRAVVARW